MAMQIDLSEVPQIHARSGCLHSSCSQVGSRRFGIKNPAEKGKVKGLGVGMLRLCSAHCPLPSQKTFLTKKGHSEQA